MKKTLFTLLSLLTLLTSSLSAECHWWNGYYVTVFGGANLKPDVNYPYEEFSVKTSYKSGFVVTAAIGSYIAPFRIEGEFGYRRNAFDRMKIEDYKVKLEGNLRTITGMANIFYDFHCLKLPVTPYLGLGIGYGNTKMERKRYQAATFNGNDKGLAWQAIVGLSCPIHQQVDLLVEYRFLDTHLRKDYNHSVGAGLRLWF